jgi:hypothetical protein
MPHRVHELSAHLSQAIARWRKPISFEVEQNGTILIRYSRDDDQVALERLAALDSRRLPKGPFVLAEVDGELVAAAPLDLDAEPLSDPFLPTANLRELLKLRARQIRRSQGRTRSGRSKGAPRWSEYDRTGSTDTAVVRGIGRTGRLVTSAWERYR